MDGEHAAVKASEECTVALRALMALIALCRRRVRRTCQRAFEHSSIGLRELDPSPACSWDAVILQVPTQPASRLTWLANGHNSHAWALGRDLAARKPALRCSTGQEYVQPAKLFSRPPFQAQNSLAAATDWQERRSRIPTQSISTAKLPISSVCHFSAFG
jgi:hypothetical protein